MPDRPVTAQPFYRGILAAELPRGGGVLLAALVAVAGAFFASRLRGQDWSQARAR